jgi:fatty-acyl-CoA synthase
MSITDRPAEAQALVYRQELTPVSFLERAGVAHAGRVAVVDGARSYTYREWRDRARRLASALRARGLEKGDRIAFLAFNSEPLLLAHFGVLQAGGVLVAVNTRLSPGEIGYILEHSGATTVFYDRELEARLADAPAGIQRLDTAEQFEALVGAGSPEPVEPWLVDEYETCAINYTSGTTGRPKGVMYHYRGAYLNALAMAIDMHMDSESRYLWTLPQFHCNGWCFPFATAAVGATGVCIPKVDPPQVWELLASGDATCFCGAPTVLTMLVNAAEARRLERPVRLFTAAAPPSPTVIAQMQELNFELEHVYGLTETYGPFTINVPGPGFAELPPDQQANLRARQGHPNLVAGDVRVVDESMGDVPADGQTMGEVVMRGNVVMKGYFEDQEATDRAFADGWFHSGDMGVVHPDGSIELRDRKKDVIISGGENISTIEVEQAIVSHPAVLECAVIAIPDERWGEVPKAYVTLKPGRTASADEIVTHVRDRLAHFKAPRAVEFGELPRTSTGKVRKYVLRDREWKGREKRIH